MPPVEGSDKMDETYRVRVQCDNCYMDNILNIVEGVSRKDHLRKKAELCINCKCRITGC